MKIQYWCAEFTNGHAQVFTDWTRAASAHNAAKYFEREHAGIVYWIEGPFKTSDEAEKYLKQDERKIS